MFFKKVKKKKKRKLKKNLKVVSSWITQVDPNLKDKCP